VSTGLHAWDEMLETFYDDEDRLKIEWAVGSILCDGPKKTLIFFGAAATGKSTVLRIINKVFSENLTDGKTLTDVSLQHDGFRKIANKHIFAASNVFPTDLGVMVVQSTGNTIPFEIYKGFMKTIEDAHTEIADQCKYVYQNLGPDYYDNEEH